MSAEDVVYRHITPDDAGDYVAYMNRIGGQSGFLAFGEGGFYQDEATARNMITRICENDREAFYLALADGNITGTLIVECGALPRIRHCVEGRLTVAKSRWGGGIGRRLSEMALDFFHNHPDLTRLTLEVRVDNERAISLYRHMGFVEEGIKRNAVLVDGEYHDSMLMAIIKDV